MESLMLRVLQGLQVGMKVVFDLLFFKALLLSGKLAAMSRQNLKSQGYLSFISLLPFQGYWVINADMNLTCGVPRHYPTHSFLLRIYAARHVVTTVPLQNFDAGLESRPGFWFFVQRNWTEPKLQNKGQQVQNPFCNFVAHPSNLNFGRKVRSK